MPISRALSSRASMAWDSSALNLRPDRQLPFATQRSLPSRKRVLVRKPDFCHERDSPDGRTTRPSPAAATGPVGVKYRHTGSGRDGGENSARLANWAAGLLDSPAAVRSLEDQAAELFFPIAFPLSLLHLYNDIAVRARHGQCPASIAGQALERRFPDQREAHWRKFITRRPLVKPWAVDRGKPLPVGSWLGRAEGHRPVGAFPNCMERLAVTALAPEPDTKTCAGEQAPPQWTAGTGRAPFKLPAHSLSLWPWSESSGTPYYSRHTGGLGAGSRDGYGLSAARA